jgi:ferric-dicitrate binding protein FerR (iron transport regulator)
MHKQEITDIIIRCLSGDASDADQQQLKEWFEADEKHQMFFDRLAATQDVDALYDIHHEVDVDKSWKSFLQKYNYQEPQTKKRNWWRYAATILLLFVAGGGLWYLQYTKVVPPVISEEVQHAMYQSKESGKQAAEVDVLSEELNSIDEPFAVTDVVSQSNSKKDHSSAFTLQSSLSKEQLLTARRITTKHDKEFWVTLDDGTLVHLNYNTRLIYPEKFGNYNRNVILEGEAYFMVAKDKSRQFVVHTPQGDIQVYGTEFNVKTIGFEGDENGLSETNIVLVKGSVGVTPQNGKELMMKPGEQCKISDTQCVVENVDVEPYVAWNTGTFVFENCPLETALKVLSHWYGFNVVYLNEDIKKERITGDFDKYIKPNQLLDAISKSSGLMIRRENNTIFIK